MSWTLKEFIEDLRSCKTWGEEKICLNREKEEIKESLEKN